MKTFFAIVLSSVLVSQSAFALGKRQPGPEDAGKWVCTTTADYQWHGYEVCGLTAAMCMPGSVMAVYGPKLGTYTGEPQATRAEAAQDALTQCANRKDSSGDDCSTPDCHQL